MNVYKGVGVHWGTDSTGVTTALGTFKLQSRNFDRMAEKESIKDGKGRTVTAIYYDESEEASLEVIPTGTYGDDDLSPTLPAIGDMVTVTDSKFTQIAGTTWIVESVSSATSNTGAMRVTCKLKKHADVAAS